jgi:SAM-dependent methyltransferase
MLDLKRYRQQLKDDTFEYFNLTEDEELLFGTGYYMNLDAETPLPSETAEGVWDELYTRGKRTDLLNNCEFNIWRDPLYDRLLFSSIKGKVTAFVHGAGIGHEVMILADKGIAVYYYEPDKNKKEFMKWRFNKRLGFKFHPTDVTEWSWDEIRAIEADLIVSYDVLEHLHAPLRTISKLGEILDPNGRFLVLPAFQYPKHKQHLQQHHWIDGYYFIKVMEGLGFKVKWQQGNFYIFQPIFNNHDVWKL